MAKNRGPRATPPRQGPLPPPVSPAQPEGTKAMPLSHATAFALADLAEHYNMTPEAAAEYAIGLWHWYTAKQKEGYVPCLADSDGEVYKVELPPPTVKT